MAARFEIYKGKIGDYYWKLIHADGRVIAKSNESYASRLNAMHNINSVKANVQDAVVAEGTKSKY